ncbi:MAG: hypothetical protein A2020_04930 [Lentisphaerae bacterium GWF2_45_14]|nr:MAG: hypothetical protein A2020_04930 [Lentisphaerae bacterium GWF2_45_14]
MLSSRRIKENVTLSDVAMLADVSVSAVSKALLGGGGRTTKVSEKTAAKIRAAAARLGYSPNSAARQLKTGKSRMIGALIHATAPMVFYDLFARVQKSLAQMGYCFVVAQSEGNSELLERNLNEFRSRNADVIISAFHEYPGQGRLREIYSMFDNVLYIGKPELDNASYVEADIKNGIVQLVDYLVAKGAKRIAIDITDRFYRGVKERIAGYTEGLAKNNISFDEKMMMEYDGDLNSVSSVIEKIQTLKPDAIIANNDLRALRIIKNMKSLNINVPDDVRVTGFDNMEFAASVSPSLTTMDLRNDKLADNIIEMIKKFLSEGQFPECAIIKPELITGESA